MRLLLCSLTVWLGWGCLPGVQAQVAAPSLDPGLPRVVAEEIVGINGTSISADNPAVQVWGSPSRVAVGVLRPVIRDTAGGTERRFKGGFAGARFAGGKMALGLDHVNYEEDAAASGFREKATRLHFAANVTDFASWGAGGARSSVLTGTLERQTDVIMVGASLRAFDLVYLGIATGNDAVREEAAGAVNHYDRDFRMFGAAFWYKEAFEAVIEVNRVEKDDFANLPPGRDERLVVNGVQAQGVYRGVLLGTGYSEIVTQNRFTFALLTLDLGYAPLDRLSAALRYSRLSHDPHPQLSQTEQESLALSVAYRF